MMCEHTLLSIDSKIFLITKKSLVLACQILIFGDFLCLIIYSMGFGLVTKTSNLKTSTWDLENDGHFIDRLFKRLIKKIICKLINSQNDVLTYNNLYLASSHYHIDKIIV